MLSKGPLVVEALFGALMNRHFSLGLFVITSVTIAAIPHSSVAQGASLKDQLVGTWIYVSSTAKRDDGSNVQQPSLQGAVTYTADGRFHFITTRTDAPKYASGVLARPSPDEAMAIAFGIDRLHGHVYGGRGHKDDPREHRDEHISKSCRSSQSAADRYVDHRRRNEVH